MSHTLGGNRKRGGHTRSYSWQQHHHHHQYNYQTHNQAAPTRIKDKESPPSDDELREAIKHLVANISKSFIVEWYTLISPTNHDFVACCETLIENALNKLADLSAKKLDRYKIGQLVTSLLHDHILNDNVTEKIQSIENQIDEHEYDICQNSVVRLFGLLCTDELRRVIFTNLPTATTSPTTTSSASSSSYANYHNNYSSTKQNQSYHSSSYSQQTDTKTTSALYTLVIAMLTKAVFMQIVDSISEPKWLYAVIIWLCKKEERDQAKKKAQEEALEKEKQKDNCNIDNNQFGNRSPENNRLSNNANLLIPPLIQVTNTRGFRSVDLEEGIDIASGNINFENPVCDSLKRPLDNIEIYGTEEVKSSSSCYVLYCIRYDGLCHRNPSASGFNFIPEHQELPIIDKRSTALTHRRLMSNEPCNSNTISYHSTSTNATSDHNSRKSFRRRMTIKRRFREFVILQLRLEENPKIRPYMKNIPKPTKLKAATQNIFSLPGITNIKLDQSTIKLRQRFLERFLIALNSSPFIANSYEFREFFSYNVNTVNMTKSKSLILQVNLNKVFVDSVRSAFSILRASLPGDDGVNLSTNSNADPDAWLTELQQSTMKLHIQTRTSHTKMELERYLDSKLLSFSGTCGGDSFPPKTDRYSQLAVQYERKGSGLNSRGGSLKARMIKSNSVSSNSSMSQLFLSRSSSSSASRMIDSSSRSDSVESIYHNASSVLPDQDSTSSGDKECRSIQMCDSVPIASKFIDIVHYSISRDYSCSNSTINFIARLLLGKIIEKLTDHDLFEILLHLIDNRQAIKILEATFTREVVTFCIKGITSSIWDDSDDPPLDMEHASLDEAVLHLTKLLEQNYATYSFIPKNFLKSLISKQLRFYLSQLSSQKRNKFVIYSFFVNLLDELESVEQHS